MRTKLFITLLSITIFLAACGHNDNLAPTSSQPQNSELNGENHFDTNAPSSANADENVFDVTLTIPPEFAGETTQDELDQTCQTLGCKSITLNDDGSVTYVMTKSQHEKLLVEIKSQINSQLQEMVGSEDYPNITSITVNDTFSQYTITTKSTQLSLEESISVFGFYIYSGMYSVFSGEELDNIHIDFVNADTGEVIDEFDSSNMNS